MARSSSDSHYHRYLDVAVLDVNNVVATPVTMVQARRLVLDGLAVPCTSRGGVLAGWEGRKWQDWGIIRMLKPMRPSPKSEASLSDSDAQAVSGAKPSPYREARVQNWPLVNESYHGAKAVMVRPFVEMEG